jgi:hypothetical protein
VPDIAARLLKALDIARPKWHQWTMIPNGDKDAIQENTDMGRSRIQRHCNESNLEVYLAPIERLPAFITEEDEVN